MQNGQPVTRYRHFGAGIWRCVVPQYFVDQTALAVAARRPFADACTPHQLPAEGMTLIVPVFTTGDRRR